MHTFLERFIRKTAHLKVFWFLYRKFGAISNWLSFFYHYSRSVRDGTVFGSQNLDFIKRNFPDLVVRNGPFKGMKYPSVSSVGSTILPKLLGSYESELTEVVSKILDNSYTDIVDIGCAEGYYAVGFGIRFPKAKIHAFDTDAHAKKLCREMADLNGVLSRLVLGDFCDEATLLSMKFSGKALIIADCEGYEKILFSKNIAKFLAPHDLLVEVHDFIDPDISSVLKKNFENTHDIFVVESIDDGKKARTYNYKELAAYNIKERFSILAEKRPLIMEWFYATSRDSH